MQTPSDVTALFQEALALHQAGKLPEAEAGYRRVLEVAPGYADAVNMVGAVMYQTGRVGEAIEWIRRAVQIDPGNAIYLGNLGLILLQSDRAGEAAEVYARVTALLPGSPEAFANWGIALLRGRKPDEAEGALRRAVELRPGHAETHFNLGSSYGMRGKWEEAVGEFRRAVELRPDYAEAYNNLGNALSEQMKFEEAEPVYRRAVEIRPDFVQAHNNLGIALSRLGRGAEAVGEFHKALELRPGSRHVYYHLANALKSDGRLDEAMAAITEALRIDPNDAESLVTLSLIHYEQRRRDLAMETARRAIAVRPQWAGGYSNLGYLLLEQSKREEALAQFEKALAVDPKFREAYVNLALAYHEMGRIDDAVATYERALAASAESVDLMMNFANSLKDAGRIADCMAVCRRAVELGCDPMKTQNYMLSSHYDPAMKPGDILEINRLWGEQMSARAAVHRRPHENDRNPERRLRIGYVSADLRHHVVGYNVLPLFEFADHEKFEVFAYSNVKDADEVTARFRGLADQWRDIEGRTDADAAEMIRNDRIDVLIDLHLHTSRNRLPLFTRKPAPVQFTFAGYPGTTGVPEIDYRLTDPYLDPPGSDVFYTEKSIRLPDSFWCYRPLNRDQKVGPLPALSSGCITFGALTNFCKVNPLVLGMWAKVMVAAPGSRLYMISRPGKHRERTKAEMAAMGVSADRVHFIEWLPRAQYLETYNRVDIGLDTFPYNGHTTSLDCYWMGVPVVTLVGETAVSRAGWCQLSNLGLRELAARTPEEFVSIATGLAGDLPRLAELRAGLRGRMEGSALMNYGKFVRAVEGAYREGWRRWCGRGSSNDEIRKTNEIRMKNDETGR